MKFGFGFLNRNPPWGRISRKWNSLSDFAFDCKIRNPDFRIERNDSHLFLLGRYNGKPSASRAECLNWKPRQDRVSLFATCFFFRLFFLSFNFNFFFINISFSELPVITASLFIQIDGLVHVMTLDGQYQKTKWRKIKAFIFHHNGKWLRTNTQKF